MDDLYPILESLDHIKLPATLATIVQVEGSAYKKESACMLIQNNGKQIGVLSAGCLEQDLAERVTNGETNKKIIYDMSAEDDLSFGAGAGCNGVVHVLMEDIDTSYLNHLFQLHQLLKQGHSVFLVKRLSQRGYVFIPEVGEPFGHGMDYSDAQLKQLKTTCNSLDNQSGTVYVTGENPLYVHLIKPKPRLLVFGAGNDAIPLVSMAADVGFDVYVSDWRPALCSVERFPKATQFIHGLPHEAVDVFSIRSNDFVVMMTHHFAYDKQLLQRLRDMDLRYVGILGSTKRTARLVGEQEVPSDVVSPMGLPIRAQGAIEIAVSVVAQLIQVVRKPSPNFPRVHVL